MGSYRIRSLGIRHTPGGSIPKQLRYSVLHLRSLCAFSCSRHRIALALAFTSRNVNPFRRHCWKWITFFVDCHVYCAGCVHPYLFLIPHLAEKVNCSWLLMAITVLVTFVISILPLSVLQPINERFARLEQYQEDKSFDLRAACDSKEPDIIRRKILSLVRDWDSSPRATLTFSYQMNWITLLQIISTLDHRITPILRYWQKPDLPVAFLSSSSSYSLTLSRFKKVRSSWPGEAKSGPLQSSPVLSVSVSICGLYLD